MTCDECMESLMIIDLRPARGGVDAEDPSLDPETVALHVAECERCTRTVELLRESQESLSQDLLRLSGALHPPETLVEYAYRRVRRERLVRWAVLPVLVIVLVSIGALVTSIFGPELKRLVALPPPVETSTFTLQCLSPEQAASLLRPYLPPPQNPMWQAERFDVPPAAAGLQAVTVSAPRATIEQVPGLLARFEQEPTAACRTKVR